MEVAALRSSLPAAPAAGIVRWSGDDSVGMQFDGLRAKETWALGKYIELLSSQRDS